MPPKPPTKVNNKGETLYLNPGGNSYSNKDPNRTTAVFTPISGENAGQRVSLKANGTKTVSGITTSSDAENRGKSANETLNKLSPAATGKEVENPLTAMYKRLSELQTQLAAAKEKEATADVKAKLDATASAEEDAASGKADLNAAVDVMGGKGNPESIEDPILRARAESFSAKVAIITNQISTLADYRNKYSEYTQQDIDDIAKTAERAIQIQSSQNQRTADAIRFAGVLAGRAQFSHVTEETIIDEVIQDGLDRIQVINDKKNTAIREARKAELDFNIDLFEQNADLAKEYHNEVESTISAMNTQVRQVAADERERIAFRIQQEERTSLILAEELVDATPEKIMQTAAMNGIDAGLLMKAVNDAKFERQSQELDIEGKKENIISSQANRANDKIRLGFDQTRLGLEQARFAREGEKDVKSDIPDDVEQGFRSVARLSKSESEEAWQNIKDYGLNEDTVKSWLDTGKYSRSQVKDMVSAHEQSQRIEDEAGILQPTATEKSLHSIVNNYKSIQNLKAEEDLVNLITKQYFFKEN